MRDKQTTKDKLQDLLEEKTTGANVEVPGPDVVDEIRKFRNRLFEAARKEGYDPGSGVVHDTVQDVIRRRLIDAMRSASL